MTNFVHTAMKCMLLAIACGLDYQQAQAMFAALSAVMKQVDLTPNADNETIAKLAEAIMEAELKQTSEKSTGYTSQA